MRNAYKILISKPERKRPRRRPGCRWEDNIRMDLTNGGWEGVDWIYLVQYRDQWRALVNTVSEPSGSIKDVGFPDQLSDYWSFSYSSPCS